MDTPFNHNVLIEQQDPAADAILSHDLPVNPISGLLLEIKPLNETATLGNYQLADGIVQAINNLRITWRGQAIYDVSGRDLRMANLHRWHRDIVQNNVVDTNNERRSIVIPIMFGRFWGDRQEGLPETRSGELIIQLDLDVADTGYDDLRYQIEAIELPGARFEAFNRLTTISQTLAATGFQDIEIPVGWPLRGLLLFATTEFAGAAPAPSFGRLSLIRDGVEHGYSATDWERLRGLSAAMPVPHPRHDEHFHVYDGSEAAEADTTRHQGMHDITDEYAYMDLDFTRDDTYTLSTRDIKRLVLRANAETADAVRICPIERVPINEFFTAR